MFTGIIEGLGEVKSILNLDREVGRSADMKLKLKIPIRLLKGLKVGDSMNINGTCLTITKKSNQTVEFELVRETTRRSQIGQLKKGDLVNIERSLRLGDRLGGHIVLGHTDGIGIVDEVRRTDIETRMWVICEDHSIMPYIAQKGSIAIDGISLTLNDVDTKKNRFSVSLIPFTLENTTLGVKRRGDIVNIEIDVICRYVINYQNIGNN
ncbi:MAG TPA: riboflavin synthase [Nitrososphaeraceae archaeon]|jgi:riboflavin synthase|nr:riboflavin synthase [Nitrososphaeraceae archaeon]